ncbi:Tad domain-containing protein [Bowmanella pacifica]|uniref:Putative Flp pilus-assembly TadG-like N-terminal domain-containing protein n=1 Tax=Bowmanella pacifica TaxID=502051 RepID=A0A917YTC0_9ALTE|nr:Tad domain-containing protein [Bowmanella pacifica]GGO65090.1 hypothetical protein GCM10010982_06060 [Bowmanella pacifica]
MKATIQTPSKQQGNILVLVAIGLAAMLSIAALALDSGHLLLNKSRLQSLVDSAALHGAKELDLGMSHNQTREAVLAVLQNNLQHQDMQELADALQLAGADNGSEQMTSQLEVSFSMRADPFVATSDPAARYVKVTLEDIPLQNFLAQLLNLNKNVAANALAGPSTALDECFDNLVPMVVCGIPGQPDYGLPLNQLYLMKMGSTTGSPIGPGNFQLIRLGDNSGGSDIRDAMAGMDYLGEACYSHGGDDSHIPTEPGNTTGPVAQGLNTRLGQWSGPVDEYNAPRDFNVCQGEKINLTNEGQLEEGAEDKAYRYANYQTDLSCGAYNGDIIEAEPAKAQRRILQVMIGDCTGETHGSSNIDYLGAGCFFLTQEVANKGNESYVIGEFIESCASTGTPSGDASDGIGPYTIVLYHVPGSTDS